MTIEQIEKQQEELQFDKFDSIIAYELGQKLYEVAKKNKYPVAINITKCGQTLFQVALPGATINNEHWLKRKTNTAYHFQTSSLIMQLQCQQKQRTLEDIHALPTAEYAAAGGVFPIILKNSGMVGTIGVSGLASEDDHQTIVDCITAYLKL